MVVALDRFKMVYNLCGPAQTDAIIDIIAYDRLRSLPNVKTLHLAKDEFVCIFKVSDMSNPAMSFAEEVRTLISKPIPAGQFIISLTASIGLTVEDEFNHTSDDLLHAASIALSRTKQAGGNSIHAFHPDMLVTLNERAYLEHDLRRGILRHEVVPYYQPIISLDTGAVKGFEALARWHHPDRGLIGPDVFVPIADEVGLDSDLLFAMIRQVCRDAKNWPPHFVISVNMSPAQLCCPNVAAKILQILFASGMAPRRLIIEITETTLIHEPEIAKETIQSLRNVGIRIALDDFGTGYASLDILCRLDIDLIKIDRSLTQSITMKNGQKLVKASLDMARSLSIPVTAEGIETTEQAQFLRDQNCIYGQGFLFGRPVSAEKALAMLRPLDLHPIHKPATNSDILSGSLHHTVRI